MSFSSLPTLNAILNGSCALLLLSGFLFIRRGNVFAHKLSMGLAFGMSILFLISYLTYHAHHGTTRFPGTGPIRTVYLSILVSHTICATLIVPLAIRTLVLALQDKLEAHKRLARWTFPIWMYVSITGVVVYWMLYRIHWS